MSDKFEEVKESGCMKLKTPFTMDGEQVAEIRYDFSKISPKQYTDIVKHVGKTETVVVPQLNMSVQANFFCKAAGIPAAVMTTQMSVPDFSNACGLARDFLLSAPDEDEDMI